MNTSESAEEFVKLYIDTLDKALRITGVGAKNIAVLLYTLSKEQQQTMGKTTLNGMLKSGKPLQIFTIKAEDMKKFHQEAKKYGILYCALANKKNEKIDGEVDIMVRDEDSAKVNRIAERFNFRSVASVEQELEKDLQEKQKTSEKTNKLKSEDEKFIDDIMPIEEKEQSPSNDKSNTEEKSQSEIFLNTKVEKDKEISKDDGEKKSVIKELKEIEKELKANEQQEEIQENVIQPAGTKEKKKKAKREKTKSNGKRFKEPKHLDTTNIKRKRRKLKKERSK